MSTETPPAPQPDPAPQPEPPPAPQPQPDAWTPPTREEYEAQQAELESARRAAARAEQTRRQHTRQQQQQAGEFESLYKESQQELDAIRAGLASSAVESAVTQVASRLRFANPTLAHRLLDTAGIEAEVTIADGKSKVEVPSGAETLIEQRLRRILEENPYLAAPGAQRQLPGAGQGNGSAGGGGAADINLALRRAAGRA
jgi:hypothetical protein